MASKSEWNEFFLDAKIPKDVAARYAVNFYKNRMSFDMLADLNKVKFHDIKKTKPRIHQFTKLKYCKKAREPF